MSIAIAQEFDTAEVLAPEQPLTLEASGLSRDSVMSLIVKTLHAGEASGMDLSDRIRLSYSILEPILEHLRVELLVQVKSAAGMGTAGYRYTLTDAGRDRANRFFEACGYVGPAPVPVAQYDSYMSVLRSQTRDVFRERWPHVFSSLVERMLASLVRHLLGRAMFIYGPPGTARASWAQVSPWPEAIFYWPSHRHRCQSSRCRFPSRTIPDTREEGRIINRTPTSRAGVFDRSPVIPSAVS